MTPAHQILVGDCLELLRAMPDESVHCCITSPPYFGLRDYGMAGQIGLEQTPAEFVARLVEVFREVRRVLRADGTLAEALRQVDRYIHLPQVTGVLLASTQRWAAAPLKDRPAWGGKAFQMVRLGRQAL